MFKTLTLKTAFALGAVLITLGGTSHAAMVYNNVMGNSVWLTNINESSPTGDVSPLFGQPVLTSGDNFDFSPTGAFSAESTDGGGTDVTDGKLSFMVVAKQGFGINTFRVLESGIATLLDAFDLGDALASVSGIVDIDIDEIDGVPVSIELDDMLMEFTPNDGVYQHSVIATGPTKNVAWRGGVTVDIAAEVANLNPTIGVTKLTVTLDNILLATTTGQATSAGIDKKDFDIIITTGGGPGGEVPEPSSALLLMLSSLAMTIRAQRLS